MDSNMQRGEQNFCLIKRLVIIFFFVLSSDGRTPKLNTHSGQKTAEQLHQQVIEILNNINKTAEWAKGGKELSKALSTFTENTGPGLSIMKLFLQNPMENHMDKIFWDVDIIMETLNRKIFELESSIDNYTCLFQIVPSLAYLRTNAKIIRDHMKKAKSLNPGNTQGARKSFLQLIKLENGENKLETTISKILASLKSVSEGALDDCNILKIAYDGIIEPNNLKGSPTAIASLLFALIGKIDEAFGYYAATVFARATPNQNLSKNQIQNKIGSWKTQLKAVENGVAKLIDNIYRKDLGDFLFNSNIKTLEEKSLSKFNSRSRSFWRNKIQFESLALKEAFPGANINITIARNNYGPGSYIVYNFTAPSFPV